MTDIKLALTVAETNFVLQIIGNLPTSSGAYPLMQKIKAQAEACVATKEDDNGGLQRIDG